MKEIEFEIKEAKKLLGAQIIGVIYDPATASNGGVASFGITVNLADNTTRDVWIEQDQEGNGHGHLSIETL